MFKEPVSGHICGIVRWYGRLPPSAGLSQGADFPGSVMPFILRGVTLYGINCVFVDNPERAEAWRLLAQHLNGDRLEFMTNEIGLSEVIEQSSALLDGRLRGRSVVDVNR